MVHCGVKITPPRRVVGLQCPKRAPKNHIHPVLCPADASVAGNRVSNAERGNELNVVCDMILCVGNECATAKRRNDPSSLARSWYKVPLFAPDAYRSCLADHDVDELAVIYSELVVRQRGKMHAAEAVGSNGAAEHS